MTGKGQKQNTIEENGRDSIKRLYTSSVKEDKRNYIEGKCEDLERHKNNSKAAFAIVKEITKKRIPRLDVIENGKTLTENEDIKERWVQYSTRLFAAQEHDVDTQWEEVTK